MIPEFVSLLLKVRNFGISILMYWKWQMTDIAYKGLFFSSAFSGSLVAINLRLQAGPAAFHPVLMVSLK